MIFSFPFLFRPFDFIFNRINILDISINQIREAYNQKNFLFSVF